MRGNTVSLAGNCTIDPEEYYTPTGKVIFSFSVAWNDRRKDDSGEYQDIAHFFNCKAFTTEGQANIIRQNLHKGSKVAIIDGHITQERWDKNGQTQSKVVIIVDDPISGMVVQPRTTDRQQHQSPPQKGPQSPQVALYDEDIPF